MAILNLLVLNSSYVGSRDLWWTEDPQATKGYNIYRAFDYPVNWVKLNATPWLGHFYRDQTSLEEVSYTVQPMDWLERGEFGKWGFRLPDIPYAEVVKGRPEVAVNPDDVQVFIDGKQTRPAMVTGIDQSVWLRMDRELAIDKPVVAAYPLVPDMTGVTGVKVIYRRLYNYVDIYTSLVRTYYTVVPVGDTGELHSPGAFGTPVRNTMELDSLTWEFRPMVERNQWLFEQVGEPAYLMFRKTRGKVCGCAIRQGKGRTSCPICFETGIVGGYYGPYDFVYVPPDSAIQVELNEGGQKVTRSSRSYLGPTPIVQAGDLIIRRNSERLVIANVIYKSPRDIILQQDFDTQLLPPGDTRYLIPVNTGLPTIYDPVFRGNPMDGGKGNGEPIVDVRVRQEGKEPWENEVENPVGRTVTFGRIVS
jgi:hypothetical protein